MNVARTVILVYLRLIIIMVLSLVTSSYLLKNLGVQDFGIYSVVGGVVVILAFLNHAMVATTQRYLSFDIGDQKKLLETFSLSKSIHILIAIIVFVLGETFGLFFVSHYLNFPLDRQFAVECVYQLSLISIIITIVNVPYVAMVLVHHKVNFYALIGIVEAFLKFFLAISLAYILGDHLIWYSVLLTLIAILIAMLYFGYCLREFAFLKSSQYIYSVNKMKGMLAFTSWNLVGVFAGLGQNVGVNIVLNIFFNANVNASRALSVQAFNSVNNINTNAQLIYNPLIIRYYAEKDSRLNDLIYKSSKFCFLIVVLLLIPLYMNLEFFLKLWLHQVPVYLLVFVKIILFETVLASMVGPLHTLVQATGKVKLYQIIISGILLLNIPLGCLFFYFGYEPNSIFLISLFLTMAAYCFRLVYLSKAVGFILFDYLTNVLMPILIDLCILMAIFFLVRNLDLIVGTILMIVGFIVSSLILFFSKQDLLEFYTNLKVRVAK